MPDQPHKKLTKNELELKKFEGRVQLGQSIVWWLGMAFTVMSSALPGYFVYLAIATVAGKETTVSMGVTVGVTLVGVPALYIAFLKAKIRRQSEELRRLRERVQKYEPQPPEVPGAQP